MTRARRGQSILEYAIIVGIVTSILFYMGTAIKRGVQSLVKITADQVGNQQNADQDFNEALQGYMLASNTLDNDVDQKLVNAQPNLTNTSYIDFDYETSNVITNAGFSES